MLRGGLFSDRDVDFMAYLMSSGSSSRCNEPCGTALPGSAEYASDVVGKFRPYC